MVRKPLAQREPGWRWRIGALFKPDPKALRLSWESREKRPQRQQSCSRAPLFSTRSSGAVPSIRGAWRHPIILSAYTTCGLLPAAPVAPQEPGLGASQGSFLPHRPANPAGGELPDWSSVLGQYLQPNTHSRLPAALQGIAPGSRVSRGATPAACWPSVRGNGPGVTVAAALTPKPPRSRVRLRERPRIPLGPGRS